MRGRNIEPLAHIVEARHGAVVGQHVAEVDRDAEQVVERVFVLCPIDPPQRDTALGLLLRQRRSVQRFAQGTEKLPALRHCGLWLFLRRHFARRDAVMHRHPAREVLGVGKVRLERSQVEVALLRVLVVALGAVPGEERSRLELSGGRGGGEARPEEAAPKDRAQGMRSHAASRQLQPAQRALARAELVGLDAEALEHGDVEVRERVVVLLVESEVLTVLEAAAGE